MALQNEALILPSRGTGNRMLIDDAMAAARMSLRWTFEVERSTTAMSLAAHNTGIALLPRSSVEELSDGPLTFRPLVAPLIKRPVGLLTRRGQSDTPEIAAFKNAVRQIAQSPPSVQSSP